MSPVLVGVAVLAVALPLVAVVGTAWLRRRLVVVTVRGPSMEPTLRDGDRVLVRRCGATRLGVGDLIVFADPVDLGSVPAPVRAMLPEGFARDQQGWLVKRLLAASGDPVPKAVVPALAGVDHATVPPNSLVVLGDNPVASHDSRHYGYVAADRLLGVVLRRL